MFIKERDDQSMNEPKKQHYVPQTYLKQFSLCSNSSYRIYVLHKYKKKIFTANIKDTAAERHFYTVKKHQNNYIWEKYYAENIEPMMNNVISKIQCIVDCILLRNDASVITSELKTQISITMMFQFLRGKHSRELEIKAYKNALPGVINNARELFGPLDEKREKVLEAFKNDDDYFKLAAMEATLNIERLTKYINILLDRLFVIFKIVGDMEFVTSDNPVMFIDSSSLDATPFKNGLLHHSTVVFFPISPKIVIAAYHPDLYLGTLLDFDGKIIFLDSKKEMKFIKMLNTKQFEQCFDQVYARRISLLESFIE